MANVALSNEDFIKNLSKEHNVSYTPSDLARLNEFGEGVNKFRSLQQDPNANWNQPGISTPEQFEKFKTDLTKQYQQRGANSGSGIINAPAPTPPPTTVPPPQNSQVSSWPGFQFNDPYTKMLEDVAKRNLDSLQGQNAQFQQLMAYINSQFKTLSENPSGYTPDEMSVLRTQALEPIEAQRQASQRRVIERAGMRGILPSSGVVQGEQANTDRSFDAQRTAASRDLAINAINKSAAKRAEALQLAQLGVNVGDQRNAGALDIAQLLYQLPRTSMYDALSVINGSSPQSVISPFIQLAGQNQNSAYQQQILGQQNQAAIANIIGQIIGSFT